MKKYKVQHIQTYMFEYEVEAENRVQAEDKAREIYENSDEDYKNGDDFFSPSAMPHVKDVFKIVATEKGSDEQ